MAKERGVRIVIDALCGHVRPEGVFRRGDGDPLPFSGWLELLRLLECALEGAEAAALLAGDDGARRPPPGSARPFLTATRPDGEDASKRPRR